MFFVLVLIYWVDLHYTEHLMRPHSLFIYSLSNIGLNIFALWSDHMVWSMAEAVQQGKRAAHLNPCKFDPQTNEVLQQDN